jgi:hypothetical protein
MSDMEFNEFARKVVYCLQGVDVDFHGESFDFVSWCEKLDTELYDEWCDDNLDDHTVWGE